MRGRVRLVGESVTLRVVMWTRRSMDAVDVILSRFHSLDLTFFVVVTCR